MLTVKNLLKLTLTATLLLVGNACSHVTKQADEKSRTPSNANEANLPLPPAKYAEVYCRPSPIKKGNYYPAYRQTGQHIVVTSNPDWAPSVEKSLLEGISLENCELGISAASSTGYACYSQRTYGTSMLYVNTRDRKADLPAAHDSLGECVQSAMGARGDDFCSRDLMDQKVGIDSPSKKAPIWIQHRNKWFPDREPVSYSDMGSCNAALASHYGN